MHKILVTGATGFVGRNLVPALLASGYDVLCAVTRPVDWLDAPQVVVDRLESISDWKGILDGIDVVIHLAAKVHVMDKNVSLEEFSKINTIATKNLAEQAAQCGVKRFIFLSSIKVNGEFTVEGKPFSEKESACPEDFYGRSKWDAEQNLLTLAQSSTMDVVILRPSLIYGPEVKANFLKMLQLVDKGWPLPFAKVKNKRTFVFIENLVSAIIKVVDAPKAANQVYLVADDDSWSLARLLRFLAQQMGVKLRLFPAPGLFSLLKILGLGALNQRLFGSLEVSNHKIKSQLGWVPPVTSEEGLRKTVAWYQTYFKNKPISENSSASW